MIALRARLLLVALIGMLAGVTACGPTVPLNTGLKQGGADIYFGRPTPTPTNPPAAVFNANPIPNFPAPLEEPPPDFSFSPPPAPPEACPNPGPGAFPAEQAEAVASTPPAPATYPFRYTGTRIDNPGQSNARATTLPDHGTRTVTNVSRVASDGSYTFDVVEVFNNFKTTDSYQVFPTGPAPNAVPGATPAAGLYLTQIVTQNADGTGSPSQFVPHPAVELFPFPASPGLQYQGGGTDPTTQQTMEIDPNGGNVDGTDRINACGQVVAGWQATMTGRIANARGGPNGVINFKLVIVVATQYGGISISDRLIESGTDSNTNVPYSYDVAATINVVPKAARAQ